jgi:AraC-like DNA-binding protein
VVRLPSTLRGGVHLGREVLVARDGLVALRRSFAGNGTRTIVTHGASLLARVEVGSGAVSFPLASGVVRAPRTFLLALPPRSVLPIAFDRAHVTSEGVAGFAPYLASGPAMLEASGGPMPLDLAGVREAARGSVIAELDADRGVPRPVALARQMLHELLTSPAPIRIASRGTRIAPETLSRLFRRAYALGPKEYCHRARLFEAALYLLSGRRIVEAAFAAGWGDLSRFYAQFRRLVGATPGAYAIKKRQDGSTAAGP